MLQANMRRLRLNEDMVRRIEDALDERKRQRRGPGQAPDVSPERRRPQGGRRQADQPVVENTTPPAERSL